MLTAQGILKEGWYYAVIFALYNDYQFVIIGLHLKTKIDSIWKIVIVMWFCVWVLTRTSYTFNLSKWCVMIPHRNFNVLLTRLCKINSVDFPTWSASYCWVKWFLYKSSSSGIEADFYFHRFEEIQIQVKGGGGYKIQDLQQYVCAFNMNTILTYPQNWIIYYRHKLSSIKISFRGRCIKTAEMCQSLLITSQLL